LPVAFGKEVTADKMRNNCPHAIISFLRVNGQEGILYDALYDSCLQQALLQKMAAHSRIAKDNNEVRFYAHKMLKTYQKEHEKIKSRILSAEQSNSSVVYDNDFFLKIYRKVDRVLNPDLELTRFLSEQAHFKYIPAFVGAIEWEYENGTIVLGMMQEMVKNNSDTWTYMLDRLAHFNEKILAEGKRHPLPLVSPAGSLTDPATYDEIPEEMKELLEGPVAERVSLLGTRTAEMHLALASDNESPDFKPEPFSLHYQRSLYSSFQSLVRKAFQNLSRNIKKLSPEVQAEAEEVLAMKDNILKRLQQIYRKKTDVVKTRIHGDYHLGQTLFTGKDFVILDFEGEPSRSYSERRLKRSPLRDVAGMVRSFHYAAYGSLFLNNQLTREDAEKLVPFVEQWYHYMRGFFVQAYFDKVQGSPFIPQLEEDLDTLMQAYVLEKSIYELNYELNNRPDWVIIPIRGIMSLMKDNPA
jgi:maltose alpha-D-glucosyltransferase/alpha-amylase